MTLDANLAHLEGSQLIRRAGDAELAYLFKHTLSQETAYGSLLVKRRRQVHLKVAQTMESLYADSIDEYAALLARHYAEAGDDEKTLEYAARAGEVASRTYANAEAIANFSLGLEAAKRLGTSARSSLENLYLRRGRALELSGRHQEALASYEEMEATAKSDGDRSLELAAVIARATLMSIGAVTLNPEAARGLCDQALNLARELGDRKAEAKILWTMSLLYNYGLHEPRRSVEYGEQSLSIARRLDLREQMAYTLNDLSYAYMQSGNLRMSQKVQSEAGQLWRELDNKPMLADNLHLAAMSGLLSGDLAAADAQCQESYAINQSIGNLWGEATSQMVDGYVVYQLGEPSHAIRLFEEALRVGEISGAAGPVICAWCGLGEVYCNLGAFDQGIRILKPVIAYAEAHFASWAGWVRAELARLYTKQGDVRTAETYLSGQVPPSPAECLARYVPPAARSVYIAYVELALGKSEYRRAIQWLDDMIAFCRNIGIRTYLPEFLCLQAKAMSEEGNLTGALAVLEQARAESEALHDTPSLWPILAAQARIKAEEGDLEQHESLRRRAREIVEIISGRIDAPELREAFLTSPDVRALM